MSFFILVPLHSFLLNFCQPPIRPLLVLWDHLLPAATPWHSIQQLRLFSFSGNIHSWQCHQCTPIPDTLGCSHDKPSHRHIGCYRVVGSESNMGGETAKFIMSFIPPTDSFHILH